MRKTYRLEVKNECRERYRAFIEAGFTAHKLSIARVLCLAGCEALEILEVYDLLGVPRKNIVCLEQDRKSSNEIRRRNLGIDVRHQTLDEFIDDEGTEPFDIVSLDFTGQLGRYAHALQRLRARGRVDDHAIFFTNFCGVREAGASKGIYAWAETESGGGALVAIAAEIFKALRSDGISDDVAEVLQHGFGWLFAAMARTQGALRHRRSEAIHQGVRRMLRCSTNSLVEILFRECDHDGSLTREVREFLHPDIVGDVPHRAKGAAAAYAEQLAIARKHRGVMPPSMSEMLMGQVEERIRAIVASFSNPDSRQAPPLDIEAGSRLLSGAIDSFIGGQQFVVAAESYKYVSGRSPMYVDMFRTRRIGKFDALRQHLALEAGTLMSC